MIRIHCGLSSWAQPGLESVGHLCRGHRLGSVAPLGFSGPVFLETSKMSFSSEFHAWETRSFHPPWESENVTQRMSYHWFRGRRRSSHVFWLRLCFPEAAPSYFSESWKIPRGVILPWVLGFHFTAFFFFSWWKLRWRVVGWWLKKRQEFWDKVTIGK